eukprot:9300309-Pyramimonas_sp.AAC.1
MRVARANGRRASDWVPVLNDSEGGGPSCMELRTAYMMELFNMPVHRERVLSVIDGRALEE